MKPGSFDTLHFEKQFKSYDKYEIPFLKKGNVIETDFIAFNIVTKTNNNGVHCFVYDYYLERIWKRPECYVKYLEKSKVFFTPDYSLYTNIPLSLQIFNTYRNRWVGVYMQEKEINVIPSISWSNKASYQFCFAGVEANAPVAISTVGILKANECIFKNGCEELKNRISPINVYVYGTKYSDYLSSLFNIIHIETYSKSMNNRINNKRFEKT